MANDWGCILAGFGNHQCKHLIRNCSLDAAQRMQFLAEIFVLQQHVAKNIPVIALNDRLAAGYSASTNSVVSAIEHRHYEAIVEVAQETMLRQCAFIFCPDRCRS